MTTDAKNTKITGGKPVKPPESSDSAPEASAAGRTPASAQPRGNPPPVRESEKPSPQKRWTETRGLLQQALAEWEKSEEKATEILKEAESERAHLEGLLLKLKAKLDELS